MRGGGRTGTVRGGFGLGHGCTLLDFFLGHGRGLVFGNLAA